MAVFSSLVARKVDYALVVMHASRLQRPRSRLRSSSRGCSAASTKPPTYELALRADRTPPPTVTEVTAAVPEPAADAPERRARRAPTADPARGRTTLVGAPSRARGRCNSDRQRHAQADRLHHPAPPPPPPPPALGVRALDRQVLDGRYARMGEQADARRLAAGAKSRRHPGR